jgi:lipid A disaccharide synthetase
VTPRLVVTVNGPGELMGWARPFVRAVYELDADTRVTIVFVPCPYATGREPQTTHELFPRATIVPPKQYARFLMGRAVEGMEKGPGALQYLGGDLYHAKTIAKRMGLTSMTYKFSRRNFAHSFVRFFALDEANAAQLRATGAPPDRVRIVGNLVADSVLESVASPSPSPSRATSICIFPGSRPPELRALLPFFLDAVMRVLRERPELTGSVSIAPFNSDDEIRASLQAPDSAFGGVRGELVDGGKAIVADGVRFAVDRSGRYEALSQAALVIATPGTKCIEAAVLGRPLLVVLPLNRTDEAVVPGMAGYLHRVPVVGRPLKRWLSRKIERRFKYVAQPNIDADKPLVPELRGVLSSQDIAARALSMLADPAGLDAMGAELVRLYAHDAGAAARMAREALSVAVETAQPATGTGS